MKVSFFSIDKLPAEALFITVYNFLYRQNKKTWQEIFFTNRADVKTADSRRFLLDKKHFRQGVLDKK